MAVASFPRIMPSDRSFAALAVGVALFAGLLRGVQSQLPSLLIETLNVSASLAGLAVAVTVVAAFVLDPLALFAFGYLWGQRATVRSEYAHFAAVILAVSLVGYGLGHVLALSTVPDFQVLTTALSRAALGATALGFALRATLAAVAGGAIAEFRSGEPATAWPGRGD